MFWPVYVFRIYLRPTSLHGRFCENLLMNKLFFLREGSKVLFRGRPLYFLVGLF